MIDIVAGQPGPKAIDIVHRIYRSGHDRYCKYRPWISPVGIIYCLTCDSSVDSLADDPEWMQNHG